MSPTFITLGVYVLYVMAPQDITSDGSTDKITIRRKFKDFGHYTVETVEHTGHELYHFYPLDSDEFDRPVVYVGSSGVNNYPNEQPIEEVPEIVLDVIAETGVTVITGVDAGWAEWNGRPEFSETYIDLSDAEEFEVA